MELSTLRPLWLLLPIAVGFFVWLARARGGLPANWEQQIDTRLKGYIATHLPAARNTPRLVSLLLLWLLIAAAMAAISWGQRAAPALGNLAGRVLVLDIGAGDDQSLVVSARRFISADDNTPIGLVVATSQAFDVVPLTTDRAFLERYLQVLSADLMPVAGRDLMAGIEAAEAMLARAQVLAGQIVLFVGDAGPPGHADAERGVADLWLAVADRSRFARWRSFSRQAGAQMVVTTEAARVSAALSARMQRALGNVKMSQRRELTPWFVLGCLSLWLYLYCRRQLV